MFYNARYYSPYLNRFVSADTIVPNGDKASVIPLTVDFHEPMFLAGVAQENAFTQQNGFWSQLSGKQKEKAKLPWGPQNPQALNRYSYVLNNPLKYIDQSGHEAITRGDDIIGFTEDGNTIEIWAYGERMKFDLSKVDEAVLNQLTSFKQAVISRENALDDMLTSAAGLAAVNTSIAWEAGAALAAYRSGVGLSPQASVAFIGWGIINAVGLTASVYGFWVSCDSWYRESDNAAVAFLNLSDLSLTHPGRIYD